MSEPGQTSPIGDNYVLASGEAGAKRLELLQRVYGSATERVCREVGLAEGWRVADIGCGTGSASCWFAQQVGPDGAVTGLDASPAQLTIARGRASQKGLANVVFMEGSAYEPGLPPGQFDLVFCRFLLCHLQRPADALREMVAMLRPGGVLVVQDLIVTSIFTDPVSPAYQRFIEVVMGVGAKLGVDYCLGRRLHQLFREAGLMNIDVVLDQPAFISGEQKRFWEYTFVEASPAMLGGGFLSQDEFERLAAELSAIGTDDDTLVAQACMPTVRGTRPE
jgi:SAM-dependent methyltransferase